ncbi:27005_t:CDS:1, partial [Gigaspora margarita]
MVPETHTRLCENNSISLMDIDLSWTIPRDSAGQLINFLRSSRNLKELKLILTPHVDPESNRLRIEVIEAVVNELHTNDSLEHLDLQSNLFGPEVVNQLADALQINTTLVHLNLDRNLARSE